MVHSVLNVIRIAKQSHDFLCMNTIVSLQNELRDFEASLNFLSGLVYWLRTKRIALYHIRAPLFLCVELLLASII